MDRYRSRRNLLRVRSTGQRKRPTRTRRDRGLERYTQYRDPLERLWGRWIALGRGPDKSEVGEDLLALTEGFGSLPTALRFIEGRKGPEGAEALQRAGEARVADLEVYFALTQFEGRKSYKHMERGLQRDIKAFFGDYTNARVQARELLFRIADPEAIAAACRTAAEHGLGWLREGTSLQLHTELVEQLPPLLRVYVGCAAVLYGDYANADLVKVHIGSGKLSLMRFDDFAGQTLPRMVERVKIKLREQHIEYYTYGDKYPPPFLYYKSRYINEEFPNYPDQVAFDTALEGLGLFDLSGYGPAADALLRTLEDNRWAIEGFRLVRASSLPSLDAPCGRNFRFRGLVECGETQAATGLANLPKQAQSYNALHDLATRVLDPVIDYFGMVRLTYGFCSPELARRIPGRIDPKRDQHVAHERNRLGRTVCERLGAAVDFIVEDEDMLEVAQWVVANTPFDRLYYYGADKPIHVSVGPNNDRQVVRMVAGKTGRLLPRVIAVDAFLALVH